MTSFGVLPTGFSKKNLANIKSDIESDFLANIATTLNLLPTSVNGQIIGIFSDKLRELWDVAEAVYQAQYPNSASGSALDDVASITGALRLAATASTVTLTCTGTAATVLAVGRQARVPGGTTFETTAEATIAAATAWAPTTAYAVGDVRKNDTPDRIYVVTVAGTSAGSGGPTGTGTAIVDGTVTWRYLGDGDGFVDVAAEATLTGPRIGNAFTITEIVTAVSGWDNVTNQNDADPGTNIETDAAFRIRREALLTIGGNATVDAIRAALLATTGVTEAIVFENVTLVPDGDGIPGKAFRALVLGGTDTAVATTIFQSKPAGIETDGAVSEVVTDSAGNSHTIEFSRPTTVDIFVDLTIVKDGNYPADGDTQVKNAICDLINALMIGQDVIALEVQCAPLGVSGVVDVSAFAIGTAPSPTLDANIPIASDEVARCDTGDITLIVT